MRHISAYLKHVSAGTTNLNSYFVSVSLFFSKPSSLFSKALGQALHPSLSLSLGSSLCQHFLLSSHPSITWEWELRWVSEGSLLWEQEQGIPQALPAQLLLEPSSEMELG